MKPATVELSESFFQTFSRLEACGDAIAEWIRGRDDFKILFQTAIPVSALSEPNVQENVKKIDLIWAVDSTDKAQCALIGGRDVLHYCALRQQCRSLSSLAFAYDAQPGSFEELSNRVKALKQGKPVEFQGSDAEALTANDNEKPRTDRNLNGFTQSEVHSPPGHSFECSDRARIGAGSGTRKQASADSDIVPLR